MQYNLPSWFSHCQSTPLTTLAPGKIPREVSFLLFLRLSTSTLCVCGVCVCGVWCVCVCVCVGCGVGGCKNQLEYGNCSCLAWIDVCTECACTLCVCVWEPQHVGPYWKQTHECPHATNTKESHNSKSKRREVNISNWDIPGISSLDPPPPDIMTRVTAHDTQEATKYTCQYSELTLS